MQQFIEFITNHWMLSTALVVILVLLVQEEISRRRFGIPQLGPLAATQLMSHEDAIPVDVREDEEYRKGHIAHALHIPLGQLDQRLAELEKYRDRPLLLVCRSGSRSNRAGSLLRKAGFESIYNLAGGIMAWENANLPITRK
ncbi:rhodanese-like domain-containing protein [Thiohalobacter sp. IOR34]|uniref:rhodanese-like domain-containing protein n=1 Tax=Thiohalobacter sp. IOR34 TaxID=3057176 RepID=UPI0025B0F8EB|nr:rhodanese-like domain-containing protein [Thiohalobacter sp. IOR34]WJW75547.1 rhodanese-like domain-containing protein [Thiohalobacter sp. IOR34]